LVGAVAVVGASLVVAVVLVEQQRLTQGVRVLFLLLVGLGELVVQAAWALLVAPDMLQAMGLRVGVCRMRLVRVLVVLTVTAELSL
jgi:hypothetical protein